ncbi:hypothetical protein BOTBODRAFT_424301 [Botryobasidium botryosum FD-172 SS1]|uniref:Calcineurin-like phosphoesterase domain-containing protein n=1 Tax=Botryobasidium botryosum (strain FD-172 SS1) TaxID=930990 RepID=A0A067MBM6_BOTB1|nr:hypothetical protein BOTBODRAFT_424301 [Botryobasidium botryosum FD-172 SS1]
MGSYVIEIRSRTPNINARAHSQTIQILSDLHLEIESPGSEEFYQFEIPKRADILALLGDIGCTNDNRLFGWLEVQLKKFSKVIFVPGNHEPYRSSLSDSDARLTIFAAAHPNSFIYLNRSRHDLTPTLTILGCTLWSSLNPEDLDILSWSLTDFKRIEAFTPALYADNHDRDISWLCKAVESIRENEPQRRVLIFTHHAPTVKGTGDPKYEGGPANSAFATELTGRRCWGSPVCAWAFGHTHWSCDFTREGVRVYSNQRGYGDGTMGFDSGKLIEV